MNVPGTRPTEGRERCLSHLPATDIGPGFCSGGRGMNPIHQFLKSEDGPTATEYAVMLALIVVVSFVAITSLGTKATGVFESVDSGMPVSG